MLKTHMRSALLLALVALPLALAACGPATSALPNEVDMVAARFSTSSITIKAGQAVNFVDPAGTGATHTLCLGSNSTCDEPLPNGPQALHSPGFTINAGDPAKAVTFDTPGTYAITCSIHPAMNLTVIVQ
ncbi:MAG TPA: plastocyanin/azurin family copper-binding protein [Ktedonobacterales bacterium]|nr:plastocyanin/azurin family copper-binding protein [Ktedonobacterales bacterium]